MMTDAYTCPDLAWLPWWNSGVAYAELEEQNPAWVMPVATVDPETGGEITLRLSAGDMSLHHFLLFWGYHDGRL